VGSQVSCGHRTRWPRFSLPSRTFSSCLFVHCVAFTTILCLPPRCRAHRGPHGMTFSALRSHFTLRLLFSRLSRFLPALPSFAFGRLCLLRAIVLHTRVLHRTRTHRFARPVPRLDAFIASSLSASHQRFLPHSFVRARTHCVFTLGRTTARVAFATTIAHSFLRSTRTLSRPRTFAFAWTRVFHRQTF